MADPGEDEDYDLKDEELVDFEGSDYGFESAEEEETVVAPDAPLIATAPAPAPALVPEGGEVEDVKYGQGDGVVVQPLVVFVVDHPPEHKFPPNPDLEDGELDDAAMPEGSDPEAVANGGDEEGENNRRERKRRKVRYSAERQLDSKGRRGAEETASVHSRQFRGRGSDKMYGSQRNNYSKGRKGANAATFRRGNFGPGIMGPGRPPVLMEYGGHLPSRIMDHGIPRPIVGVVAHGRPNRNEIQNHRRGSMAVQEHILRHQQLVQMTQEQVQCAETQAAQAQAQLQSRAQAHSYVQQAHTHAQAHAHAQAQVHVHMANSRALRASISGSRMRPTLGLDLIVGQIQASHSMVHLQVQTPDLGPHIQYRRPLEGFGACAPLGTDFSAVQGSVGGPLLNQPCNRDRTAAGRQLNAWSPSSATEHEISSMPAVRGKTQGQCRVPVTSPRWGDPPVRGIPSGLPSSLGVISHTVPISGSSGIASGCVVALGTPKRQGSLPWMAPNNTATNRETANMKNVDIRPQVDCTWRTNGGNRGGHYNNGTLAPNPRTMSALWSNSLLGGPTGNKRSREIGMDQKYSLQPSSRGVGNCAGTRVNNLIKLGGPVTKSRVLSVSGFPENTSMAVVVEAFEKRGKILDFKKDERRNAFHITFSSVAEAVSAKRSLHRSLLNGRQITVDYTVQRYLK